MALPIIYPLSTEITPNPLRSSHVSTNGKLSGDRMKDKTASVHQRLPLKTKILFGAGDIFGGGAFNIINFFYAIFLTDVIGLNMIFVSPIFLIGKFWDAITDPVMGSITDRTNSRFGRRRPYFLAGILLGCASFFTPGSPKALDGRSII